MSSTQTRDDCLLPERQSACVLSPLSPTETLSNVSAYARKDQTHCCWRLDVLLWCNVRHLVTTDGCLCQALRSRSFTEVSATKAAKPAGSGKRFRHGGGRRGEDRGPEAGRRLRWRRRSGERRRHCRAEWRWRIRYSPRQFRSLSERHHHRTSTRADVSRTTAGAVGGNLLPVARNGATERGPCLQEIQTSPQHRNYLEETMHWR